VSPVGVAAARAFVETPRAASEEEKPPRRQGAKKTGACAQARREGTQLWPRRFDDPSVTHTDQDDLAVREPPEDLDRDAHAVIGAAIEVHRCLGPGLFESFYERALCIELGLRGIPFTNQTVVALDYKGHPIGETRLDLRVGHGLVVELKSVETLTAVHFAQVLCYLRAARCPLGLLINFNVPFLRQGVRRIVLSP